MNTSHTVTDVVNHSGFPGTIQVVFVESVMVRCVTLYKQYLGKNIKVKEKEILHITYLTEDNYEYLE